MANYAIDGPIGVDNPEVYIVGEAANSILSNSGQYLQKVTQSLGLTPFKNLRLLTLTREWTSDSSTLDSTSMDVIHDIARTKPKVVVGLGAVPAKVFTGIDGKVSDLRGNISEITVEGHQCYFITTFHPNYILNNTSTSNAKLFVGDFRKAVAAASGKVNTDSEKDLRVALTADDFINFCEQNYTSNGETSYDIETNGKDVLSDKARVVGFSVSPDDKVGTYVVFEALEYQMPESDVERCKEYLRNFLSERHIVVHNQLYERPYTLNENWLGYELHDDMDDTLVMSRLMLGGNTGAGLKDQCRLNLGYTKWSESLDQYYHRFEELQNSLAPTTAGNLRNEHKVLKEVKSIEKFAEYMFSLLVESINAKVEEDKISSHDSVQLIELLKTNLMDDSISWSDTKEVLENYEIFDKRKRNCLIASWKMFRLIERYYPKYEDDGTEYEKLDYLVAKAILDRIDEGDFGFISYGLIPLRIIAPYGALDAVACIDLRNYYNERMTVESKELEIDLFKGYSNWMKHFKMAYIMERNGAYWQEDLVKKEKEFLEGAAIDATRALHTSPLMADYLVEKKAGDFSTYIVTQAPQAISESCQLFISDIIKKPRSKNKKQVVFSNGDTYDMTSPAISNLLTPEIREKVKSDWIKYLADNVFSKFTKIKEFKDYFNPGSPAVKEFLGKHLVNDEVRAAKFLFELKNKVFTIENYSPDAYPDSNRVFLLAVERILDSMKGIKKSVADLDEDEMIDNPEWSDLDEAEEVVVNKISTREGFLQYLELLKNSRLQSTGTIKSGGIELPDLVEVFAECLNYNLTSTKEPDIIKLHEIYQLMGIDIEDESTWNEEYKFLYNFRLYKKCMKLVSSYITGKLGFQNAWVVNKSDLESGSDFVPRKTHYQSAGLKTDPGQAVILQTSFKACAAETGRWRAGIHTIPFGSSIKELYTSRFTGGTIAAPDFSQMEIRAMAAAANDQKLLGAFLEGRDIHRFNAQQIFNREDVTDIERRFSKMASFSILYGASEYSVAQNYFKGDVKAAENLFHNFYSAFPDVKKFIDERHREMELTGKVKLLTNRFLNITPKTMDMKDVSKAKRNAQNYPIQGASSDVAGVVLYEVQKYIENNNFLSKPFCFIHDSIEIDLHPSEMIQISKQIIPLMNQFPYEEFGVPCQAGLTIGPSMGEEIEVEEIVHNEDFSEATFHVVGFINEIEHLAEVWKRAYPQVSMEDVYKDNGELRIEDQYIERSELFFPKRAYSRYTGTTRQFGHKKIHITTR
ncbi:DNA polymerase A [Listeria phage LIS04]|nr:DNA polymerase A [Listeria phage LIS04]